MKFLLWLIDLFGLNFLAQQYAWYRKRKMGVWWFVERTDIQMPKYWMLQIYDINYEGPTYSRPYIDIYKQDNLRIWRAETYNESGLVAYFEQTFVPILPR